MREVGQCAGGVQIGLVADHGGEDEGRNRIDQRNSPFSAVLFGKDLDQAVDKDVQEVGVIALMDEDDAGRKLLQQRRVEQACEAFLLHFGKQRQSLQLGQFVRTQQHAPDFYRRRAIDCDIYQMHRDK